jgi:hypothetical protein
MQSTEEWRPIAALDGYYEVSNYGRIRCGRSRRGVKAGSINHPGPGSNGRLILRSEIAGVKKTLEVHRLVALAFLGDPEPGQEVCHNDGDCLNNNVSNLRWDTHAANMRDAINHGTFRFNRNPPKTHCKSGHPFVPENIRVSTSGQRVCRTCARKWSAEYAARAKVARASARAARKAKSDAA